MSLLTRELFCPVAYCRSMQSDTWHNLNMEQELEVFHIHRKQTQHGKVFVRSIQQQRINLLQITVSATRFHSTSWGVSTLGVPHENLAKYDIPARYVEDEPGRSPSPHEIPVNFLSARRTMFQRQNLSSPKRPENWAWEQSPPVHPEIP